MFVSRQLSDESDSQSLTPTQSFGEKTITYWGSFCLNLNNNTGPGMVSERVSQSVSVMIAQLARKQHGLSTAAVKEQDTISR